MFRMVTSTFMSVSYFFSLVLMLSHSPHWRCSVPCSIPRLNSVDFWGSAIESNENDAGTRSHWPDQSKSFRVYSLHEKVELQQVVLLWCLVSCCSEPMGTCIIRQKRCWHCWSFRWIASTKVWYCLLSGTVFVF